MAQAVLERPATRPAVRELQRGLDTLPKLLRANAERFGDRVAFREKDLGISQTSGTTALPKLAMLSHANLISQGMNFHTVEPHIAARDEFVSYLPFAWIGEQMLSTSLHQLLGFTVNFPEEPETAQRDFREITPHFTFAPARIYEGLHTAVTVRIMDSGWLRRKIYDWGLALGGRIVERRNDGTSVPLWMRTQRLLARWLVYRPLLDKIGFKRMRVAWNGGAPLGPDYFKFFHSLGVNLKQIYGQTEMAGISCVHRDGAVHFWTMGYPIVNTDLKVTDDGEIVSRSPALFLGYFKNPEATAKALRGGWLYSGDYGTLDRSHRRRDHTRPHVGRRDPGRRDAHEPVGRGGDAEVHALCPGGDGRVRPGSPYACRHPEHRDEQRRQMG